MLPPCAFPLAGDIIGPLGRSAARGLLFGSQTAARMPFVQARAVEFFGAIDDYVGDQFKREIDVAKASSFVARQGAARADSTRAMPTIEHTRQHRVMTNPLSPPPSLTARPRPSQGYVGE